MWSVRGVAGERYGQLGVWLVRGVVSEGVAGEGYGRLGAWSVRGVAWRGVVI